MKSVAERRPIDRLGIVGPEQPFDVGRVLRYADGPGAAILLAGPFIGLAVIVAAATLG